MTKRGWSLIALTGRALFAGILAGASFACVSAGHTLLPPGDLSWTVEPQKSIPVKNTRLNQQPRPASAPTAPNGYAVELTGDIEFCPPPRQPRPISAAPSRLDELVSTLPSESL